jgi:hypothetical protein
MRGELGDHYTEALRNCYADRVPGGADLVTYWFEKARAQIEAGKCLGAGLVATQSIRKGSNQKELARICDTSKIFNTWSDEVWINDGAAVGVSLVCFGPLSHRGRAEGGGVILNGEPVEVIHADLSAGNNLTQAKTLKENSGVAFEGTKKYGNFDIAGEFARQWLKHPNPNGRPNSDVVRPWANGQDVTSRPLDTWIVDFGVEREEQEAALYETPYAHALRQVKHARKDVKWWLHERPRPALRAALAPLKRYIATPRVAKHRMFVWLDVNVLPDSRLNAIARDDVTFGILSSRIHEVWSLANASMHGVGNDPTYNAKSCFETFPFPEGLTPKDTQSLTRPVGHPLPQAGEGLGVRGADIAAASKKLNELRNNWLNPAEWVDWVRTPEEEKAGYPLRPVAKAYPLPNPPPVGEGVNVVGNLTYAADLQKRTLTNLYNARPAWLDNAHKILDAAVAKAYGWDDYTPEMPDEEVLRRLLVLNLARAK